MARPPSEPRTRIEIINQVINRHKSPPTRVLFFPWDLARFLCPVFGSRGARLSSKSRDTTAIRHARTRDTTWVLHPLQGNTSVMKKIAASQLAFVIFYAICIQRYYLALFLVSRYKQIYDYLSLNYFFSTSSFFNNFGIRLLHYIDCDRNVPE